MGAHAQEQNTSEANASLFSYTPTPQTQAFIRYGSNPVDLHTGNLTVTIPLYTYSDRDFTLPISASYSSQGFIPGKQTGILGMNWFLNCGGTISREIKGIADDHVGPEFTKLGIGSIH